MWVLMVETFIDNYLIFLSYMYFITLRLQWDFLHHPKDICLHREGQVKAKVTDIMV